MLPTLVDEPPEGDDWQHELKYDGYRTQLIVSGGDVQAFTRNGFNWTDRYRPIVAAAGDLGCDCAIIDGEMIVQDEQGRSDFGAFQEAMLRRPEALVFMAFDLLHIDGTGTRSWPLYERRAALRELVGCNDPSCRIQFSDDAEDGAALFAAADRLGLEGIVSKKRSGRYRSGHSLAWRKVKCFAEGEFVVIGTERGDKAPTALLARETHNGLEYAGGAMVTLSQGERDRFWTAVDRLAADAPPIPMRTREARWVQPEMKVRARFLKGEEMLRHATVKELIRGP